MAPEICDDENLSWIEKAAMTKIIELDLYDRCYLSNAAFAVFLQVSRSQVTAIIAKLVKKGYLKAELKKDGPKHVHERILHPLKMVGKPTITSVEVVRKPTMEAKVDGRKTEQDGRKTVRRTTKLTTKKKDSRKDSRNGSLHKRIIESCQAVHGKAYKNYGMQGKAAKELLITAGKQAGEEDIEEWLRVYMNAAHQLWMTDKFWHKQPFSPTLVNTASFFDLVMKKGQEAGKQDDMIKEIWERLQCQQRNS